MFFAACRRIFDNGIRESGGIPQVRPAWETTPSLYPISGLAWGAVFDARDTAAFTTDGAGDLAEWKSSVAARRTAQGLPFSLVMRGPGQGLGNPSIVTGTSLPPSGDQYIGFNGTDEVLRSYVPSAPVEYWPYTTYTDTAGAGLDEGFWPGLNTVANFLQTTPAFVPLSSGGSPRGDGVNDYLDSPNTIDTLFAADGSEGTITLAVYMDAATAASLSAGSTAQTPYLNPALFSDGIGYMGVHFSDAGFTAGIFDGTARDVGSGPNDGWQMATVSGSYVNTYVLVQARWSSTVGLLEIRVAYTGGGISGWVSCACGAIWSMTGVARLLANYNKTAFAAGLIYGLQVANTRLSTESCDDVMRDLQASVGADFGVPAIPYNSFVAVGPEDGPGTTDGCLVFSVSRLDAWTATAVGASARNVWCTTNFWLGMGATVVSTINRYASFMYNTAGSADRTILTPSGTSAWHLTTQRLERQKHYLAKDNDASTLVASATDTDPTTVNQGLVFGYSVAGDYGQMGLAWWSGAYTKGWSSARIRDVERYLMSEFLTGAGTLLTVVIDDTVSVTDQANREVQFARSPSDTAVVTDSGTREVQFGRSANDTITATETVTRETQFGRSNNDTVTTTDSGTRETVFERASSDTVSVTDQGTREVQFGRAVNDTVSATDQTTRELQFGRENNDTVVMTDAGNGGLEYARAVQDTVSVTDAATREAQFERPTNDTVSVTDQFARETQFGRSNNDSVVMTDSGNGGLEYDRSASDSISLSEQVARELQLARENNDTAVVTDTAAREVSFSRQNNDTAVVTDSGVREVQFGRENNDTAVVVDSGVGGLEYARTASDAVSVVEAVVARELARDVQETVSVTDSATREGTFERSANDAVVVAEAAVARELSRDFNDAGVVVADQVTRELQLERRPNDTISATDTTVRELDMSRLASDAANVTEQTVRELQFSRENNDTVAATDAGTAGAELTRTANDTVSVVEAPVARELSRDFNDAAVSVTDQASKNIELGRTVQDTVGVTDQADRMLWLERFAADSVIMVDDASWAQAGFVSVVVNDAIDVVDSFARELYLARAVGDTATTTDTSNGSLEKAREVSDTVAVTDVATATGEKERVAQDSIAVSDVVVRELQLTRAAQDALTLTEQVSGGLDQQRVVQDSISVTDAVATARELGRTISDAIGVTDVLLATADLARVIADTADVVDEALAGRILAVLTSDAVSVTDQAEYARVIAVVFDDAVSVTDAVDAQIFANIILVFVQDNLTVDDAVTASLILARTVADEIGVEDAYFTLVLEPPPVAAGPTKSPMKVRVSSPIARAHLPSVTVKPAPVAASKPRGPNISIRTKK